MATIETFKKYAGLGLFAAGMVGAGYIALKETTSDEANVSHYTLAAGMRNVTANSDTCRVAGTDLMRHGGGVYDFRRQQLIVQWRTHATTTPFDRITDPTAEANLQTAYRLLPAPHRCPAPGQTGPAA